MLIEKYIHRNDLKIDEKPLSSVHKHHSSKHTAMIQLFHDEQKEHENGFCDHSIKTQMKQTNRR
ncbi:hypothetical protein PCK2_000945 [Pneumocystis canis]|nr:hypothetical protein PCK2_000945 [Pneumocystis canis]